MLVLLDLLRDWRLSRLRYSKTLPGCQPGRNIVSSSCCISCCMCCILGQIHYVSIKPETLKSQYLCGALCLDTMRFFYIICYQRVRAPLLPLKQVLSLQYLFCIREIGIMAVRSEKDSLDTMILVPQR